MKSRKLKFQFGPGKNGQFYWRIRGKNGEIIAQGEGYKNKRAAKKVYALLGYEPNSDVCEIEEQDANGKPVPVPKYLGTLVTAARAQP